MATTEWKVVRYSECEVIDCGGCPLRDCSCMGDLPRDNEGRVWLFRLVDDVTQHRVMREPPEFKPGDMVVVEPWEGVVDGAPRGEIPDSLFGAVQRVCETEKSLLYLYDDGVPYYTWTIPKSQVRHATEEEISGAAPCAQAPEPHPQCRCVVQEPDLFKAAEKEAAEAGARAPAVWAEEQSFGEQVCATAAPPPYEGDRLDAEEPFDSVDTFLTSEGHGARRADCCRALLPLDVVDQIADGVADCPSCGWRKGRCRVVSASGRRCNGLLVDRWDCASGVMVPTCQDCGHADEGGSK